MLDKDGRLENMEQMEKVPMGHHMETVASIRTWKREASDARRRSTEVQGEAATEVLIRLIQY
jgi:hypothetical protein